MNLSCPWSILFLQGHSCSQWAQKKLLPSRQSRQRKPKVGLQKPRAFPRLLRFLMPRMRRWVLQAVDGMCFLMFFVKFIIYYLVIIWPVIESQTHHLIWSIDGRFDSIIKSSFGQEPNTTWTSWHMLHTPLRSWHRQHGQVLWTKSPLNWALVRPWFLESGVNLLVFRIFSYPLTPLKLRNMLSLGNMFEEDCMTMTT